MKKSYAKIKITILTVFVSLIFTSHLFAGPIASHPRNVSECSGSATVSYKVTLSFGYINPSYQWQALPYRGKIWTDVSGTYGGGTETTANLVMVFDKFKPLTTDLHNTQFRCVVTATPPKSKIPITEYSQSAYLYVYTSPTITSQPSSATKNAGESVTFSVYASSALTKYYQWQKNNVNITGAIASSYTLSNLSASDAATYRCRVSNNCGTRYSSGAVLTVNDVEYEDGWFVQASPTSQDIRKVDATDRYNAWAVTGGDDLLLKTSDGGENWTSVNTGRTYGRWQSIDMLSTTNIFVGGSSVIGETTDGGTTWSFFEVSGLIEAGEYAYIYGIQFTSSTVGYAVGRGGLIIKTTDGGTTWVRQNWKNDATPVTDVDLRGLFFLDSDNGWTVGINGVILKTTNGGSSWTALPSFNSTYLGSIFFLDTSTGYATGMGAYKHLLKTTDGGTTWNTLADDLPYSNPYDVQFIDADNGYLAGQVYNYSTSSYEGAVLKTNDAGLSWHIQKVIDANQLYDMIMLGEDDGWAVGDAGEIQRTATGGCFTPTVNLYEDLAFCASGTHTMVADTFESNLNCSYLWNTSATTGQLTVDATDSYSVVVTNLCNVTATDDININVFELPVADAGEDATICDGDSTQLIGSGGISYSWHDAQYLNYSDIQNPLASPNVGSTKFELTVTDENGCVNTDEVYVTVNAIPTATFTAPGFVCGNETANFNHTGTSGINNFFWKFEDSLTSTGASTATPTANWIASNIGMKNLELVVEKLGCYSDTIKKQLEVRVVPTADFTAPYAVCSEEAASLDYTGTAPAGATYNWIATGGTITGSGQTITVSYDTEGTKTIGLEVIQNACNSGLNEMAVIASYPFSDEEICLVTIDLETGKNMVVWEKTPDAGIAEYRVYKESNVAGTYNILDAVSADSISLYVDLESEPEKKQELYKISVVDTCGYESDYSPYHKTMFLQYVSSDNGVNLTWQDYGVEDGSISFESFIIYRGSDSTQLEELETISSSLNAYTDTDVDALSQRMYYRVGGVKAGDACDPAGILDKKAGSGPFVHSLSNLEDNRMVSGINDWFAQSLKLKLYPNPFNDRTMISYDLRKDSHVKIELYNILGEKISVMENDRQFAGNHTLEINASELNYQEGLYYIRLYIDNQNITRKLILKK